jgi:hypothetical protein
MSLCVGDGTFHFSLSYEVCKVLHWTAVLCCLPVFSFSWLLCVSLCLLLLPIQGSTERLAHVHVPIIIAVVPFSGSLNDSLLRKACACEVQGHDFLN